MPLRKGQLERQKIRHKPPSYSPVSHGGGAGGTDGTLTPVGSSSPLDPSLENMTMRPSESTPTVTANARKRSNGLSRSDDEDDEDADDETPLNHRRSQYTTSSSVGGDLFIQREHRPTVKRFCVKKQSPEEQKQWIKVKDLFCVDFFFSDTCQSGQDLDYAALQLWETHIKGKFSMSTEVGLGPVRSVRQRLWNMFTDIKEHVRTTALSYYGLETLTDNLKRAHRAGWLLQDDRFLYPDPEVRKQRFFHPAIISSLAKIFFSRAYCEYGVKFSSDGRRMLDQMPAGAVAWICVAVQELMNDIDNRPFRPSARELQDEFITYVGAQRKLNVHNLTYEIRQYSQINCTTYEATSVRMLKSDDEDDC